MVTMLEGEFIYCEINEALLGRFASRAVACTKFPNDGIGCSIETELKERPNKMFHGGKLVTGESHHRSLQKRDGRI